MRELSTPSLFDVPPTMLPTAAAEAPADEERRTEKLARDFIRWCFGFGAGFRNAPDIINLRNWCGKTKLKLKASEENELLIEARRLYLKRIEQFMKKSEAPMLGSSE